MLISKRGITLLSQLAIDADLGMGAHDITLGIGQLVDGRDVGDMEAGATADLTGAEIKALYEALAQTNAFTDVLKAKLDGCDPGAKDDQTGAEIKTAYEGEAETNAFMDAEKTKLGTVDSDADVTGDNPPQAHGVDKHTNRTKTLFVPLSPHIGLFSWAETHAYPYVAFSGDGESLFGITRIPLDYVSGIAAYAVVSPTSTGDIVVDVRSTWATFGEVDDNNEDWHGDETLAVTIGKLEKLPLGIAFNSPDKGSAPVAGEIIGLELMQDTGVDFKLFGFILEYLGDQ